MSESKKSDPAPVGKMVIFDGASAPTLEESYRDGIAPLIAEEIDEEQAFERTMAPLRTFMLRQVRGADLELFLGMTDTPVAVPAS